MTQGYWDIHNHILPGVDDGSSCMDETQMMLAAEYKQGIRNIIFTPHYRPGMFEISADERELVYRRVTECAGHLYPDLRMYLGCEFFAHKNMVPVLRDSRCRMAGTEVILLEFSTITPFCDMFQTVSMVSEAGYRIILAHPERYYCLQKSDFRVRRLRIAGAQIQLNAGGIMGREGRKQKHFCHSLLKENLADFIASDAHDIKNRPVEMERCMKLLQKRYGSKTVQLLFEKNQRCLFGNMSGTERD
ncbi:MAG: capsular biosynthesis protein [Lachnospiraceae bacterium]|nr:capsular biosynthesis protein [Lachnospiraceae bacterium]